MQSNVQRADTELDETDPDLADETPAATPLRDILRRVKKLERKFDTLQLQMTGDDKNPGVFERLRRMHELILERSLPRQAIWIWTAAAVAVAASSLYSAFKLHAGL